VNDLEGHLRSLELALFERIRITAYQWSIVIRFLFCQLKGRYTLYRFYGPYPRAVNTARGYGP